jgi:hypothetical protein
MITEHLNGQFRKIVWVLVNPHPGEMELAFTAAFRALPRKSQELFLSSYDTAYNDIMWEGQACELLQAGASKGTYRLYGEMTPARQAYLDAICHRFSDGTGKLSDIPKARREDFLTQCKHFLEIDAAVITAAAGLLPQPEVSHDGPIPAVKTFVPPLAKEPGPVASIITAEEFNAALAERRKDDLIDPARYLKMSCWWPAGTLSRDRRIALFPASRRQAFIDFAKAVADGMTKGCMSYTRAKIAAMRGLAPKRKGATPKDDP